MIEIGSIVECSVDTLERNFADVIKKGRERGKSSLRRKQFEMAMNGNVTMLIWLGKQHLGQTEKVEQKEFVKMTTSTEDPKVNEILTIIKAREKDGR